mmetsp:Transcript_11738/g.14849  ORF Transcript_11738/g.14849 Transcript_11738/m.14849 type:complete len:207 (+) Transcript_11738:58-678(+)
MVEMQRKCVCACVLRLHRNPAAQALEMTMPVSQESLAERRRLWFDSERREWGCHSRETGTHSLGAGESSEAVDVVGAAGRGVLAAAGAALVASLHVLEHLATAGVAETVGRSAEVGGEESTEGGDGGGASGSTHNLGGVGRSEEERSVHLEALQVGVGQLADGETVHTLEGVTSDHNGVRVVSNELELAEPRASLGQSLSDLFGLV